MSIKDELVAELESIEEHIDTLAVKLKSAIDAGESVVEAEIQQAIHKLEDTVAWAKAKLNGSDPRDGLGG